MEDLKISEVYICYRYKLKRNKIHGIQLEFLCVWLDLRENLSEILHNLRWVISLKTSRDSSQGNIPKMQHIP